MVALRVGLDAGPLLDPPTGIGRYTRELWRGLEGVGAEVSPFAVSLRGRGDPNIKTRRVPARVMHELWRRTSKPGVDGLVGDVNVVHGTNFVLPPASAPGVVTIHDVSYLRDDAFPGAAQWTRMVPWSLERAAGVITVSRAVADELIDLYGVDASLVDVTHEGVAPVFFGATPLGDGALARMGIARPFVLAAGTIEPRKNLPRLLEAWSSLGDARAGWTLVLAGPKGWGPGLPETDAVVPTGWVGDETLPGLLAAADLFVYPSLYEGFGLPPLEAMAAGTACVVGNYPAAAEVVADAALVVDALDVASIANGVAALLRDNQARRSYVVSGKARAAEFTWDRTAKATMAAYEKAIARS